MNASPTLAAVAVLYRVTDDVSEAFTGNLAFSFADIVAAGPALMTVKLVIFELARSALPFLITIATTRSALAVTLAGLASTFTGPPWTGLIAWIAILARIAGAFTFAVVLVGILLRLSVLLQLVEVPLGRLERGILRERADTGHTTAFR